MGNKLTSYFLKTTENDYKGIKWPETVHLICSQVIFEDEINQWNTVSVPELFIFTTKLIIFVSLMF